MSAMTLPFLFLSALGFFTSLYVHLSALTGADLQLSFSPYILHGGIFVVFLPAVLVAGRMTRHVPREKSFHVILEKLPVWMRVGIAALFAYSFVNFFLVFFLNDKSQEVDQLRGFSGHWMIFYAVAFCILYAARQAEE